MDSDGLQISFATEKMEVTDGLTGLDATGKAQSISKDSYVSMVARNVNASGSHKHVGMVPPSKDELYGPWMVVESQRRRPTCMANPSKSVVRKETRPTNAKGSRFATLEQEEVVENAVVEEAPGVTLANATLMNTRSTGNESNRGLKDSSHGLMVAKKAAYKISNLDKKAKKINKYFGYV
ncbi:hypothetical protein V6N13_138138 [Hibiscus sabdariffa]